MSTALESAVEAFYVELLALIAQANALQNIPQISDDDSQASRLVSHAKDQGEDKGIKVSGSYGRSILATITLKINAANKSGADMASIDADVKATLNGGARDGMNSLAPFKCFRIWEVAESDLIFDKQNWEKHYTILITAII